VVVGQVKVGHTQVKRAEDDRTLQVQRPVGTEVLPEPKGDLRQLDPAAAAAAVGRAVVPVGGRDVGHWSSLPRARGPPGSQGRRGPVQPWRPQRRYRGPWRPGAGKVPHVAGLASRGWGTISTGQATIAPPGREEETAMYDAMMAETISITGHRGDQIEAY